MKTILTVNATNYTAVTRPQNGIVIDSLKLSVDEYWELEFTVFGCSSSPPFTSGQPVALVITNDDGSSPLTVFAGNIAGNPIAQGPTGWVFAYHCYDLKRRADYIPIQNAQGSQVCSYNLSPDDTDYDPTRIGQTVGQIVQSVLQVYNTAQFLNNLGVGNYSFSGSTATISATTASDLTALVIVPNTQVRIEGNQILSVVDQFVRQWHPQYCCWVQADGTIRFGTPFGFTVETLTIPGAAVTSPDPVEWPQYSIETENCYTQYNILGQDYDTALLSAKLGTLVSGSDSSLYSTWTLTDFTNPKGSSDSGTCSITSSTTATVTSSNPLTSWASGWWPSIQGIIVFVNTGVGGVQEMERKLVTVCSSLSPGGSATITWDSSQPLAFGSYSNYYLIGQNTPLAFVDRLFEPCEPSSGATALGTFIGARLTDRDPNGYWWANNSGANINYYPTAKAIWSLSGSPPFEEIPLDCHVLKATGQILLTLPAVVACAQAAGTLDGLLLGYPGSALGGLWTDIQVMVPYSRGAITATAPSGGGYTGTAYSTFGISRPYIDPNDNYISRSQTGFMQGLAAEHLLTMCNATIEGTIFYHGLPTAFSPFGVGLALHLVMPATSPLDGVALPVRTTVISWPSEGVDQHTISFRFSNRKAPFTADSKYLHPNFTKQPGDVEYAISQGPELVADPVKAIEDLAAFQSRPGWRDRARDARNDARAHAQGEPGRQGNQAPPIGNPIVADDRPQGPTARARSDDTADGG